MKFRKKPVEIEAIRFVDNESAVEIIKWLHNDLQHGNYETAGGVISYIEIQTLEGTMTANPGDWVIRGIKGEFYPCKPDIFESTYEEVPE